MPKFEYKHFRAEFDVGEWPHTSNRLDACADMYNGIGQTGWEIVQIFPGSETLTRLTVTVLAKRQIDG